jgi:hypothetical protein
VLVLLSFLLVGGVEELALLLFNEFEGFLGVVENPVPTFVLGPFDAFAKLDVLVV